MEYHLNRTKLELIIQSDETVASNMSPEFTGQAEQYQVETASGLTPMHKYFLAVLVLALVNAILGAIYFTLTYKRKAKHWFTVHEEDPLRVRRRRQSSLHDDQEKHHRRKFSTHIALAVGQNKESARRVSSVYL